MRLRLSDAATAAVLAEHYRTQAAACQQMALMSVSPFKEVWLELAAGGQSWSARRSRGSGKAALIAYVPGIGRFPATFRRAASRGIYTHAPQTPIKVIEKRCSGGML
jgi:hypothetical protein